MAEDIQLLMLTHNFPRYHGDHAGVFLSLLARQLVTQGIRPVVLAPHDEGAAEYEENSGVKVYRFRYARDTGRENLAYQGNMQELVLGSVTGMFRFRHFLNCFRRSAFDVIAREKIQVVGGHWLVPTGFVMKAIARKTSLPMILSSHGTDIRLMDKYGKMPFRYLRNFCRELQRWTVVSSFLKQQVLRLDPELETRLEVLPLPHDEAVFFRDKKVKRDEFLIVSVTRFTEQKRVAVLINAFAHVSQRLPDTRLEIYGSGPLQNEIERLVTAHGVSHQVRIIPPLPQEELREAYNRASVVVLNSHREGFGLTLSEAMLCGAAVVGTRSGGITDIIEHEQRGLLVEPDDSRDLAEAIIRLIKDNSLRQKLADNGYQFARENYASGPLAARYAKIVREAVGT